MEEKNTNKLNTELPEVPRLQDGKIDIEKIATGKNEKGNYIVPDEVLKAYYKELPDGTTNESNTSWSYNGGLLNKANKEVQTAGGKALQAKLEQRRTFADVITTMLCQKASKNDIEDLELKPDADNLDVIIAAAAKQASRGNVKAMEFLRDTIGQKPSEKIDASVTALTPEDKEMLQRVQARLDQI